MADGGVMDLFRLEGRVALVAGGSRGLGRQMALSLAEAGAATVICSRNLADCVRVAAEIAGQTGRESVGMAADVTREADVAGLFERVGKRFGRLDVLIK